MSEFEQEFRRARSLHSTWGYAAFENSVAARGMIRPVAPFLTSRTYFPMARPTLATDLAKVRPLNEADVLGYVRRYGPLSSYGPQGDPLVWIWAHANATRVVVSLHRALARGDDDRVWRTLHDLRTPDDTPDLVRRINEHLQTGNTADTMPLASQLFRPVESKRRADLETFSVIVGTSDRVTRLEFPAPELDPHFAGDESPEAVSVVARRIRRGIINHNSAGIDMQLSSDGLESVERVTFRWKSLINVVYRHLLVLVSGGTTVECEHCGMPFLRTHGSQRFCPDEVGRESLCAMNHRQIEHRRNSKRKKGQHDEQARSE